MGWKGGASHEVKPFAWREKEGLFLRLDCATIGPLEVRSLLLRALASNLEAEERILCHTLLLATWGFLFELGSGG